MATRKEEKVDNGDMFVRYLQQQSNDSFVIILLFIVWKKNEMDFVCEKRQEDNCVSNPHLFG